MIYGDDGGEDLRNGYGMNIMLSRTTSYSDVIYRFIRSLGAICRDVGLKELAFN